jgi:membrane peptidoglycan carboxypeptidase
MLAGAGVVGGTYYFQSVPPPSALDLPETTTVYFADGKTQLAKLAQENRIMVPVGQILPYVKQAVISAEDRKFYDHGGIDYTGIARAAWNNFTGGEKQGASTITQQYARHAADLQGVTYARKVREAVMASKLNSEYSKDEILGFYLNTISFGRGAYGIEAAAKAYFGPTKSVAAEPGTPQAVTVEEAAVLAAVIKQPEPVEGGHPGYDPTRSEEAAVKAKERWDYVLNGMVEKGELDAGARAPMEYPKVIEEDLTCIQGCGVKTPVGNVVNYVKDELQQMAGGTICNSPEACSTALRTGGYRITTTIDPRIQTAAQRAANQDHKDKKDGYTSPLYGHPKELIGALVAVNPKDGRVLAYYGGNSGTDTDYAGVNSDGSGPHSPGSTFKIYTEAAALREGISTQSHWDATIPKDPDTGQAISNAGRTANCGDDGNGGKWCTLEEATIKSYNVPFYFLTKAITPEKVVQAAKDAGVAVMKTNEGENVDLTAVEAGDVAPSKFFNQVGYGQYGITVLDHANGIATFANRGVYHKAHFIAKVEQKDPETGKWEPVDSEKVKGEKRFEEPIIDDLNAVLQKIPGANNARLAGGREALGKTGTWELNSNTKANGDAWMIGATPQIAAAAWVGAEKPDKTGKAARVAIKDKWGANISGGGLPARIWKQFMDEAHKGMDEEGFRDRKGTGDPDHPAANGVSPSPSEPSKDNCPIPLFCRGNGNGNGGNDGGLRSPDPPTTEPTGGTGGGTGDGTWVFPSPIRRE